MRHATLYVAMTSTLDPALVRRAATGADVSVKRRGLFRTTVEALDVRWPALEVRLNLMEATELAEHLRGFAGFCRSRGCEAGAPLLSRVAATRLVVGISSEPDDASGRVEQLVWSLARELDALVFLAPGDVFDGSGRPCLPLQSEGSEPDEDADELVPPTRERVAQRALALCAVVYRAFLDADPPDDAPERLDRLRRWLAESNVGSELEPGERALVDAPLGSLDERAVMEGTWRSEGLAVLAWWLGRSELPGHDQQADPRALWDGCDFLGALPPHLVTEATQARSDAERDRMRSQLLGLHWRLRDFRLQPRAMDFRAFAQDCWFGKMDVEGVMFAGDDLAIQGVPISEAPPAALSMANSIAMERHQAINWLCGMDRVYSDVDTST